MIRRRLTKVIAAAAVTAGALFLSLPNLATLKPAQDTEAVFLTSDGEVIPAQTMGSSARIEAAIEQGRGATLFSNASVTLFGAPLESTYLEDGTSALISDSPFTGLPYYHEEKFDGYELFDGIDVSKWQNDIDWKACKEAGVDFAIIRVGYRKLETGELMEDPYYKQNIKGALENDISVGVYIFSQALTTKEAKEEAQFLIKRVKKYDVTLPLVMDYEGGSYTLNGQSYPGRLDQAYENGTVDKDSATKTIKTFCKYVENAGYTPMIYANSYFLTSKINGEELGKSYKIWQARYSQSTNPSQGYLYYPGNYEYWQYSETGTTDGIKGKIDCNFLYKNFDIKTKKPTAVAQTDSSINLKWNKTADALGYYIYRLNPDTGKYQKVASTRENTFTDDTLEPVSEYSYKIKAYWTIGGKNYTANSSSELSAATTTLPVTGLKVSSRSDKAMKLSWNPVSKAKGYIISQYDPKEDAYIEIATVSGKNNTSFRVADLKPAKEYQFVVAAYRNYNEQILVSPDSKELFAITKPAAVQNVVASDRTTDSITLKWNKQSGVTGYKVARYNMTTRKWESLALVKKNTFTDTELEAGTLYKYRVRAYKTYDGKDYYGEASETFAVSSKPGKTTNLRSVARTVDSITLKWTKQTGVTGYKVYRLNEETGKWNYCGKTGKNAYKDTGLEAGKVYKYRVRAYELNENVTTYGKYSAALFATTRPAVPTGLAVAKRNTKSLTITWDYNETVSGYTVYRCSGKNGKFEIVAELDSCEATSYTDTGLSKGTEYQYKLRAYKIFDGIKYNTDKTKAITVKTKN